MEGWAKPTDREMLPVLPSELRDHLNPGGILLLPRTCCRREAGNASWGTQACADLGLCREVCAWWPPVRGGPVATPYPRLPDLLVTAPSQV